MPTTKTIYPFIALALFAILICFQLYTVFHTPLWFDDAIYGTVAKNLAQHHGYRLTLFDHFILFDKGITAGPAIILPGAAMIAWLGNAYWVPQITGILLINLLLIAMFLQFKSLGLESAARWQSATIFLLSALLITNHDIGAMGEKMHVWHAFMGDIVSALLIIIGTIGIARNRLLPEALFLGGLAVGLAALCKLQALVGASAIGGYLALHTIACRRPYHLSLYQVVRNLILYGAGVAVPVILFETIKLISLGSWQAYAAKIHEFSSVSHEIAAFASIAAILKKLDSLAEFLGILHIQITPTSATVTSQIFWLFLILTILLFIKVSASAVRYLLQRLFTLSTPAEWASEALLCACGLHLLWWIFACSVIFPRYAVQGLIYGCACLALYLGQRMIANPKAATRFAVLIAILIIGLRLDAVAYLGQRPEHYDDLKEQQEVMQLLSTMQQKNHDTVIFSCGFAFEMEFLMPRSGNFIACERMQEPEFARNPKLLLSYSIDDSRKVLKQKAGTFWFEEQYNPDTIVKRCPTNDLYQGKHYTVATCHNP